IQIRWPYSRGLLACRDSAYWTARVRLRVVRPARNSNYGAFRRVRQIGVRARSQRFKNFDFAATAKDLDGHTFVMAMNQEIDGGVHQPQVFNLYVIHMLRKNGMVKADLALRSADAHTKARTQEQENCAGGPGLRSAGNRIQRRTASTGPLMKAAEKLREALEFDVATDFEESVKNFASSELKTIERKTEADQRVIVWPHGAIVIGHRVVARFRGSDSSDAPAGEKLLGHQRRNQGLRPLFFSDFAKQGVARVRGPHATLLFLAVQGEGVHAHVFAPERLVKLFAQSFGLGLEPFREFCLLKGPCDERGGSLGGVDVRLHFA